MHFFYDLYRKSLYLNEIAFMWKRVLFYIFAITFNHIKAILCVQHSLSNQVQVRSDKDSCQELWSGYGPRKKPDIKAFLQTLRPKAKYQMTWHLLCNTLVVVCMKTSKNLLLNLNGGFDRLTTQITMLFIFWKS